MKYEKIRKQVLDAILDAVDQGMIHGTSGNIAMRDDEDDVVAITPRGISYKGMTAEDIAIVDLNGKWLDGPYKPLSLIHISTIEEYLEEALPEGGAIGFDGRTVSMGEGCRYEAIASRKKGRVVFRYDLIDKIWKDRPGISEEPVFILEEKYAGESTASKLKRIRSVMEEQGATMHLLTTLDDICWTLNIRGNDIEFFPLVLSCAIISMNYMHLYIDEKKLDEEIKDKLAKDGVILHSYNAIYMEVCGLSSEDRLMIDPDRLNYALYRSIPKDVVRIEERNPEILFKAIKNPVEIENIRQAQILSLIHI